MNPTIFVAVCKKHAYISKYIWLNCFSKYLWSFPTEDPLALRELRLPPPSDLRLIGCLFMAGNICHFQAEVYGPSYISIMPFPLPWKSLRRTRPSALIPDLYTTNNEHITRMSQSLHCFKPLGICELFITALHPNLSHLIQLQKAKLYFSIIGFISLYWPIFI